MRSKKKGKASSFQARALLSGDIFGILGRSAPTPGYYFETVWSLRFPKSSTLIYIDLNCLGIYLVDIMLEKYCSRMGIFFFCFFFCVNFGTIMNKMMECVKMDCFLLSACPSLPFSFSVHTPQNSAFRCRRLHCGCVVVRSFCNTWLLRKEI